MTIASQHDRAELLEDAGFVLTRSFLWVLLCSLSAFAASAVVLAWFFRMDVSVKGEGVLVPSVRHRIKPALSGIVSQVHVASGDLVGAGQRLVSLDDREWKSQLERVDQEMAIISSQAYRLISDRHIAESELKVARIEVERAALEVRRVRIEHSVSHAVVGELLGWRRNAVDDLIPVQRARGALEQKRALWRLAEARESAHDGRVQELGELHTQLEKWQQERKRLLRIIAQTVLLSPLDGVVLTAKLKERQGDRVEAGEIVVEVADPTQLWEVETDIHETDIPRVRVGHPVRIEVDVFPHMEYEMLHGEVVRIGMRATPTGYPVRIQLRRATIAAAGQPRGLFAGMTASVRIVVDRGRILELLWRAVLRGLGSVGADAPHVRLGEAGS